MRTPSCISSAPQWTRSIATVLLVGTITAVLLWLGDTALPDDALALQAPAPLSSPIDPTNDPPIIWALDGDAQLYQAGAGPVPLDQAAKASVTDVDSPLFDAGSITVSITGGAAAEDVLGLEAGMGIALSAGTSVGSVVSVYDTPVGTVTQDGRGGANLAISLGTFANPTAASLLLGAATYENLDTLTPLTGTRTIRFVVNDGAGGMASAEVTVTVAGPDGVGSVYLPLVLNAR